MELPVTLAQEMQHRPEATAHQILVQVVGQAQEMETFQDVQADQV
jgi:hypothetical protein